MSTQQLPLSALQLSPNNPRKTGGADVSDLMASIEAEGLLSNLVVSPAEDGIYWVEDGGRRLRAMKMLHEAGRLDAALIDKVPCRLVTEANGAEAGLHANIIRIAMHPADEFVAFQQLSDQGRTVSEIAERFGKTQRFVEQRLRLARVRPEFLQDYRDGGMTLDQLMALASTTNHELQRQAWTTARGDWERTPDALRRFLGRDSKAADDRMVKFVGLQAYQDAGGRVNTDLFTDRVSVLDLPLLDTLAMDKLHATAKELEAAGWSFADVVLPDSGVDIYDYGLHPQHASGEEVYAKPEDGVRTEELQTRMRELADAEGDEFSDEEQDELQRIEDELDAIKSRMLEEHKPEVMAQSGVILALDADGDIAFRFARLKPGQKPGKPAPASGSKSEAKPKAKPAELSAVVLNELSVHRSHTAASVLGAHADLAVCLLIDTLLGGHNGVQVRASPVRDYRTASKDLDGGDADELARLRKLLKAIPGKDRLAHLLKQTQEWRNTVLAAIVATHFDASGDQRVLNSAMDAIQAQTKFDMASSWNPACDDFLGRIHADLRTQAVTEACGKDAAATLAGLKKSEHVAATAKLLAGTGWLPKPLRGPGYALKNQAAAAKPKAPAKSTAKPKPARKAIKKAAKKITSKKPAKKSAKAGA